MAKVELKQPIVEEISNSIKDAQSVVLVTTAVLQLSKIQFFKELKRSWCSVQGIQKYHDASCIRGYSI